MSSSVTRDRDAVVVRKSDKTYEEFAKEKESHLLLTATVRNDGSDVLTTVDLWLTVLTADGKTRGGAHWVQRTDIGSGETRTLKFPVVMPIQDSDRILLKTEPPKLTPQPQQVGESPNSANRKLVVASYSSGSFSTLHPAQQPTAITMIVRNIRP